MGDCVGECVRGGKGEGRRRLPSTPPPKNPQNQRQTRNTPNTKPDAIQTQPNPNPQPPPPTKQAYAAANERFGEVVLSHYRQGDMVWAQDYHLMLLPQILKAAHPKMKVCARAIS